MTGEPGADKPKKLLLKIEGMHCTNCEVVVERKFGRVPGVSKVRTRHGTGRTEVSYSGDIDLSVLQSAIAEDGYTVSPWKLGGDRAAAADGIDRPDYAAIGATVVILAGLYFILRELGLLPENLAVPESIGYGLAFVIGLVASVSTCMAVTGGLLVSVAAKYNAASGGLTAVQRFRPHLYFNAGRLVSYASLGGVVGGLGSTLTLSAEASGILVIVASVVMIALGLQMLKLLPSLGMFQPRMPKFIAHRIHALSEREAKGSAFVLGASTFFLPCGFTQALQFYVLSKGSIETGAVVMLAFALGTLPALLSLSALSSFATGVMQRHFLRFAGVTVVMLGAFNIQSGFTLTSLNADASAPAAPSVAASQAIAPPAQTNEKQVVKMKIVGYQYQPFHLQVVAGVPVEWHIDARQATGCGRGLFAPKARIARFLSAGDNVITFTPDKPGEIRFNCSMGMMTPGAKFIVSARASAPAVSATPAPPTKPSL